MLDELHVENLGIIEQATLEPGPGLVAVTGETGAGKTLLLGALRMLRGDQASADRIGPHGDEARIEGRFVVGEDEVVAARRLQASRSRAYLDGSMVPAKALAERFDGIVEIVAQHEHVGLGRESSLRQLIDGLLDDTALAVRDDYLGAYGELRRLEGLAESLAGDERSLARDLDLLRHQASEIERAGVTPDEDAELTARLQRLRHAREITDGLAATLEALDEESQAIDLMRRGLDELRSVAKLDADLEPLTRRLESVISDAEELTADLRRSASGLDLDPSALEAAEERAALVADLKRKYGATIAEVFDYAADATERAEELEQRIEQTETISADIAAARHRAVEHGRFLAVARRTAAERLAADAGSNLTSLGFRDPALEITVEDAAPGAAGADRVQLVFASDRSLKPGPVGKVASGGELSRLVLAIRVAAGVAEAPVVAFDEVDAGIGGTTALAMGERLASLATTGQVLVVTHLPQVAAFAHRHFIVERAGASASVRLVEGQERLAELARMLGGMEQSERGQLHAEELLALVEERRR